MKEELNLNSCRGIQYAFRKDGAPLSREKNFATSFTCLPQTAFDRQKGIKAGKGFLLNVHLRTYCSRQVELV